MTSERMRRVAITLNEDDATEERDAVRRAIRDHSRQHARDRIVLTDPVEVIQGPITPVEEVPPSERRGRS